MCINQFFLLDEENKCDGPVYSKPKLNINKIKKFNNNDIRFFDSISLDREITTEIISNNLNNIPLKSIRQTLLFKPLQFNIYYYNKIKNLNKDGKIRFYPFDSNTPINYYLIYEYNHITNRIGQII
jgi:hypothetical protein